MADAVERHATKDPGMRCVPKRVSVVCHPQSEPQEKIATNTKQGSTPTPFSHLRRSISIRGNPASLQAFDRHNSTGDMTRDARSGPTQDVTRASSSDRGDNADQNRAEHPSSLGSDSRWWIITKREPREIRSARTSISEQHIPRLISGKMTPSEHWTETVRKQ